MDLQKQFTEAQKQVNNLSTRPTNEELLLLYALYKQATTGDVQGERPGGFDFKGAAKYDAWAAQKGKTTEQAMQEYIALAKKLVATYNA